MCGIVGIHSLREPRPIDRSLLGAMSESITHRGPNSDGFHLEEGRVGLGMRRLSWKTPCLRGQFAQPGCSSPMPYGACSMTTSNVEQTATTRSGR